MGESNTILSRFFSQNMLQHFTDQDESSVDLMRRIVRRYCIPVNDSSTNETVISDIYHYVGKAYRNEYFYKNTLLNKLLINAHRLNTTTALTEVPIAKSKADFIMINGKAVVYEIKTELDTFERLHSQLIDYYKAFDHVCVVTSENQLSFLEEKLRDTPVGIYILTKANTIRKVKEPQEYREMLNFSCIFKILNKPEYEQILHNLKINLPEVPPVHYYRACKQLLCSIPTEQFYELTLKELKKRNKIEITDFSSVPTALRFLLYFSKHQEGKYNALQTFLTTQFKGE